MPNIAGGIGQPIYVVMDPLTRAIVGRYSGAPLGGYKQEFIEFLRDARKAARP